jgi:hypothetical protein
MEGGLDDYNLLQLGSPKVEENKENRNDFIMPALPTPKKPRMPESKTKPNINTRA